MSLSLWFYLYLIFVYLIFVFNFYFIFSDDYKDLIESGREQFETELRSLLPEVRLGETSDKLTTDELNLLIAHAHRKVLQLQKQVARQQVSP